jgi:nitric oxide reductase large subunit
MNVYAQIAVKIIKSQEAIIGPVAVEQASQVLNMKIDWPKHEVSIGGDEAKAIDQLIGKYKDLFGQISVEVSKEAASSLIGQLKTDKLPEALK